MLLGTNNSALSFTVTTIASPSNLFVKIGSPSSTVTMSISLDTSLTSIALRDS